MYRNFEIRPAASEPPWSAPEFHRLIAEWDGRVAGWLVWRQAAPGEIEILDLATRADFRRRGVARALLDALLRASPGLVFLEVRESNLAARTLYESAGFEEFGRRCEYYTDPVESAIVMKFHS